MSTTRIFLSFLLLISSIVISKSALSETKVGVILPLSGDFAKYGDEIRKGLEKNSNNLELIYEDEQCNARVALSALQRLTASEGLKFFLGPWCGSPQTTVAPLLKKNKQIAIVGSSAPRRIYELSGGNMFSTQHSIEEESTYNAKELYKLGSRKVVILFFENDFSRAHEKAFRENFKGQVLETLTYSSNDGMALKPLVSIIQKLNPDSLYLPDAYPLMHGIVKALHGSGLQDIKLYSVYSAESQAVADALGTQGEGLKLSYPKIGDQNALHYFPAMASEILSRALNSCPDHSETCVKNYILKNYNFDEFGVLKTELGMKILKAGKFQWLE